ncbi:MAG: caspase family protein [Bacteroidales bacterium]
MKSGTIITVALVLFICVNVGFSQSGESRTKLVTIGNMKKKVSELVPSFSIDQVGFSDANLNHSLDTREEGTIFFTISNTGTVPLDGFKIIVTGDISAKEIQVSGTNYSNQLPVDDSVCIKIPIRANERLKEGTAKLIIRVNDLKSDSFRTAEILIPTRGNESFPVVEWLNPLEDSIRTDYPIIEISWLLKSKTPVKGLKIFVNEEIPDDKITFDILPTEIPNEYRISRKVTLNEGENLIKMVVQNSVETTTSEPRAINYTILKIDQGYQEKRLALVIGNADYVHANALANPVNDAKAVKTVLQSLGFKVMSYYDADQKTMKKAIDEFGTELESYTVGLFYYAGHGIQVRGNNFLIPVDANLLVEQDVEYDCIDAGRLLGKMEAAGSITNIVILDACRNNPFERSWAGRSSSQGGGLAFMNAPSGSIVAYATSPGKTASDGTGKNGLYTEALLKYMQIPGLSIEEFFKNVRGMVEQKSEKLQTPWEVTSLKGSFYFKIK